jgi:3-oxoacyl-[acyl-carrier-protein] synthase II
VQERKVKAALLNAFGFGSNNAAVVLRRYLA